MTDCRDQRTEFDVMALDWQLANARTPSGILLCPYRLLSNDLRDGRAGRPPIYPTMQCQCQNLCTTRPAHMPACPSTDVFRAVLPNAIRPQLLLVQNAEL